MIGDVHPGSRILIFYPSRIPGSKRHQIPDLGSESATLLLVQVRDSESYKFVYYRMHPNLGRGELVKNVFLTNQQNRNRCMKVKTLKQLKVPCKTIYPFLIVPAAFSSSLHLKGWIQNRDNLFCHKDRSIHFSIKNRTYILDSASLNVLFFLPFFWLPLSHRTSTNYSRMTPLAQINMSHKEHLPLSFQ
jgi:hypothetical protein